MGTIKLALIYDESGREAGEFRKDILSRALASLNVCTQAWPNLIITDNVDSTLILAHSSELSKDQESLLRDSAKLGALVIFYSAGGIEERQEAYGRGWILSMRWQVLRQVLGQVPTGFNYGVLVQTLEAIRKRSLLSALAILSWCVTYETSSKEMQRRQQEWLLNRRKWLEVFEGYCQHDILGACGASSIVDLPPPLSTVKDVLEWLWPSGDSLPPPPNFGKVTNELNGFLESTYGRLDD
jgi:hypothetical protein